MDERGEKREGARDRAPLDGLCGAAGTFSGGLAG